jgi:GT2 family glycosyltransferase
VVVLPDGYELPPERLGWETFVFCPKSMIGQRLAVLPVIESDYPLFLDDDIAFPPDFIEKLLSATNEGYACVTGPLFSLFPQSKAGVIAGTLTASVSLSLFSRDKYVKILRSGGWSYHTFDTTEERYYPTESFAWTCFLIRTQVMRDLNMEEEVSWLERFGYAMGDDRVMAYKLVKRGYKACIVSNALYEHNDAKTSTSAQEMVNTKPSFCMGFFHVVFWKRFIADLETSGIMKILDTLCLCYWMAAMACYHLMKSLKRRNRPKSKAFFRGVCEGVKFLKTREFRGLPGVCKIPQ